MKRSVIAVLILLLVSLLPAEDMTLSFDFSSPVFSASGSSMSVKMEKCRSDVFSGNYQLPGQAVMIALPQGKTAASVTISTEKKEEYPMMLPPAVRQNSRPLSFSSADESISAKDFKYTPAVWSRQIWHGTEFIVGVVYPAAYDEVNRKLQVSERITFSISLEDSQRKGLSFTNEQKNDLAGMVANPSTVLAFSETSTGLEQLLIVTRDSLLSCFEPLIAHYHEMGIETDCLTAEALEASAAAGADLAEKIRNTVKEAYLSEKGLHYVLIGGADALIPARRFSCSVQSGADLIESDDIPSDLYYAALDGSWDNDGDGYFGEYVDSLGYDEADLLPELAVGRFPGYNRQDMDNLIAKTLNYQRNPVEDDLDDQLLLGESLWPDPETWGADYIELLVGDCDSNGYTTRGIPFTVNTYALYERERANWDMSWVLSQCAEGRNMIHHSGHANRYSVMDFYIMDMTDSSLAPVNGRDAQNPFIITHGCNCGAFDDAWAIGPAMVNAQDFSVGGLFNSRYGWFNEGTTEGPSQHLHREFLDALYGLKMNRAGTAQQIAQIKTAPWVVAENQHEQNAMRWNFYDQNLLGDPALALYAETGRHVDMAISTDRLSFGEVSVTVTEADTAADDLQVVLTDDSDSLLAAGTTDNGTAVLRLDTGLLNGDSLYCTVSGYDVIPVKQAIDFQVDVEPVADYRVMSVYPNPFNPAATVRFSLPEDGRVTLKIISSRGREVKTLSDKEFSAGDYSIGISGHDMSSGVYFCVLTLDNYTETQKIVLLK